MKKPTKHSLSELPGQVPDDVAATLAGGGRDLNKAPAQTWIGWLGLETEAGGAADTAQPRGQDGTSLVDSKGKIYQAYKADRDGSAGDDIGSPHDIGDIGSEPRAFDHGE